MKAEAVITEKENELTKFIETFDSDNQNLKRRNDELTCENNFLQQQLFKQNDAQDNPLLFEGGEEDFYPDEIREMVLDAVWEKFNNTKAGSRRCDVYKGILERNHYRKLTKQRADEIKKLLNDYRTMGAPLRSTLKDLGFTITEDGKHYRLTYYGDERYKTTLSKTGSDFREGKNQAAHIIKTMFC